MRQLVPSVINYCIEFQKMREFKVVKYALTVVVEPSQLKIILNVFDL